MNLFSETRCKRCDQILTLEEDLLQCGQDAVLEFGHADADRAGACAALPTCGTGVALTVDDGHGTPAAATAHKAREQALLGLALVAGLRAEAATQGLGGLPCGVVYDLQGRDFLGHPQMLWVYAGLAFATIRVLHEALPIIGDTAKVKLVVEDAVLALPASVDGGSVPEAATRAGDTLSVQACGNGTRRLSGNVIFEDLPQHRCFARMDLPLAADEVPIRSNTPDHPVAIAVAPGDATGFHPATLPPARLLSEVLEEQRVHRAL